MGSCFEVWSWAWDVGETPYAPPELEDDPTLPIVGYYPSLMVLTGVMAWCWCVVAWVGMKEFKHARMGGEGGGEVLVVVGERAGKGDGFMKLYPLV